MQHLKLHRVIEMLRTDFIKHTAYKKGANKIKRGQKLKKDTIRHFHHVAFAFP